MGGPGDCDIAIFAAVSTSLRREPIPSTGAFDFQGARNEVMARLNSLLRSTQSRIGRRLAEIVAIAAASLPAVGV
jgi:hypothetical protein